MNNQIDKFILKGFWMILGFLFISITTTCNSNDKVGPESSNHTIIKSIDACEVLVLEDAMEAFGETMQQKEGFPRNVELHEGKVLISACSYYSKTSKSSLSLNITYNTISKFPKSVDEFVEKYSREMAEPKEKYMQAAQSIDGVGDLNILLRLETETLLIIYNDEYELTFSTDKLDIESDKMMELATKVLKRL